MATFDLTASSTSGVGADTSAVMPGHYGNEKATIKGLSELQDAVSIANKRGLTIKEIFN